MSNMPYELQLNRFIHRPGWKYKTIRITDIAIHTSSKQPTSIAKKIKQAFKSTKPGRIYGSMVYADEPNASSPENKTAIIEWIKRDPEFVKMVLDYEKQGYKILLELPKEIPVFAGKDTVEFLASVNGKRILRRLAKNNQNH